MKYNINKFYSAVAKYEKLLGNVKGKTVLITSNLNNSDAFFSLAPLSMAMHNKGGDIYVLITKNQASSSLDAMKRVWDCYGLYKKGLKDEKTKALMQFIRIVDRKTKWKFNEFFKEPDLVLRADKDGFRGDLKLPYDYSWFKKYKWNLLMKTCSSLWKNVFNLQKEDAGIGFELIPKKRGFDLPLEDYLDNFAIIRAMTLTAMKKAKKVRVGAATTRVSQLSTPNRISELKSTLMGCELDKEVNEDVFKAYKKFSELLNLSCLGKITPVMFSIVGKGYPGRHLFGEAIGYPTLDRSTRWLTPGQMAFKFSWYPQSKHETRKPLSRMGFTQTLPIDLLIKTCNIDYPSLWKKNLQLYDAMNQCDYIRVEGKQIRGLKTEFTVGLKKQGGGWRTPKKSDSDARSVIDPHEYKETKREYGMMANIPSGECFLTPETVTGRIVGDVVISIDRSYMLSAKKPLVIDCAEKGYKITGGPRYIISKINKKKADCWKAMLRQEKNKSIPQEIIDLKKRNFNRIGEFAINTNPKAELSRYLIVNEKIADMIHIALGSGFDPDRATEYHSDIVIDSPRQELNIYGVRGGKKIWMIKNGRFVIQD